MLIGRWTRGRWTPGRSSWTLQAEPFLGDPGGNTRACCACSGPGPAAPALGPAAGVSLVQGLLRLLWARPCCACSGPGRRRVTCAGPAARGASSSSRARGASSSSRALPAPNLSYSFLPQPRRCMAARGACFVTSGSIQESTTS